MMFTAAGTDRPRSLYQLIATWTEAYRLSEYEVARLDSLAEDPPADNLRESLAEELRLLMKERKLLPLSPLTIEQLDMAQIAIDAGLKITASLRIL